LMKAANGKLSAKDVGLVIRGFVSAFGGDKFGIGQDGTFVVSISGNRGIGEPATATATATSVTAYIVPITESLVALMGLLSQLGVFGEPEANSGEQTDPNAEYPSTGGSSTGGSGSGSGGGSGDDNKEEKDDNTMLLVIGAALVGGFLLLNK